MVDRITQFNVLHSELLFVIVVVFMVSTVVG